MSLTIKQRLLKNNDCYRSGKRIAPCCMQLHTIGTAQDSAESLAQYWNQSGIQACVHYCVDASQDGLVLQFLPETYRSWADGGVGNSTAITVELMESDYMRYGSGANYVVTDTAKFKANVTRAYKTAVAFFAAKCKEYDWDPEEVMPNGLHRVFSHDEGRRAGLSSAHVDPTHIWDRYGWTMDQFRADVKTAMRETAPAEKNKETGSNGPAGIPKSKAQFIKDVAAICVDLWPDLQILPSVVIAQCCLETGYGLGSDAVELVKWNNLLGMKSNLINSTWAPFTVWDGQSFTKRTPEVYGGKTVYINDNFRVYKDYRNCIEDYMQFLRNVRNDAGYKYRQIIGWTDPEKVITAISKGGYATDPSYVTKVMAIIDENNLTQYDPKEGGSTTADSYYRVGTGWRSGKCTGQIGAYKVLANAKNACAIAGYEKYKVYGPDGKVAWPTDKTTIPQKAVRWAIAIAKDNSHGYNNTKGKRLGNPDYACSSFIAGAYRAAGVDVAADAYTSKMRTDFLKHGFEDVSADVNLRTGGGMKCGDVVLVPGKHVEMVTGAKHNLVGARGNATGGAMNGKAGDQGGGEIKVIPWWDDGWKYCLRYAKTAAKQQKTEQNDTKPEQTAKNTSYIVQAGAYNVKGNADNALIRVKQVLGDGEIVKEAGQYKVKISFATAKEAQEAIRKLAAAKISAFMV